MAVIRSKEFSKVSGELVDCCVGFHDVKRGSRELAYLIETAFLI